MEETKSFVETNSNQKRAAELNKPFIFRDDQCFIQLDSDDLKLKKVLQLVKPLGKQRSTPIIVLIGDVGNVDDDQYATLRNFYLDGVLTAAFQSCAHIVDSGLSSSIGVGPQSNNDHTDFCRNILHIGVSPASKGATINPSLSKFHSHQIVFNDYIGYEDSPSEFAKKKFDFIRRLAGKCRVVCLLFNSGHTAWEEVKESCRLGIPVIPVAGSGALADEISSFIESGDSDDPDVQAMIDSCCMYPFNIENGRLCDLNSLIRCHLLTDVVQIARNTQGLDIILPPAVQFTIGVMISTVVAREGDGKLLRYTDAGTSSNGGRERLRLWTKKDGVKRRPIKKKTKKDLEKKKAGPFLPKKSDTEYKEIAKTAAIKAFHDHRSNEGIGKRAKIAAMRAGLSKEKAKYVGAIAGCSVLAYNHFCKAKSFFHEKSTTLEETMVALVECCKGAGLTEEEAQKQSSISAIEAHALEAATRASADGANATKIGESANQAAKETAQKIGTTSIQIDEVTEVASNAASQHVANKHKMSGKSKDATKEAAHQAALGAGLSNESAKEIATRHADDLHGEDGKLCTVQVFRCPEKKCCKLDHRNLETFWEGETKDDLIQHYKDAHPEVSYKYKKQVCNERFDSYNDLTIHTKHLHPPCFLCCCPAKGQFGEAKLCGQSFALPWQLTEHINVEHQSKSKNNDSYICQHIISFDEMMNNILNTAKDATLNFNEIHVIVDNVTDKFQPDVGLEIRNFLEGKLVGEEENSVPFDCDDWDCGEKFKTRADLLEHRRKAHPRQCKHWCEVCLCSYKNTKQLANHYLKFHPNYLFPCYHQDNHGMRDCNRVFATQKGCDIHMEADHDPTKVSYEEQCNKVKDVLNATRCIQICNQKFETEIDLNEHINSSHQPVKCDEGCGKEFNSKLEVEAHKSQAHRKYECQECGETCESEGKLELHIGMKHKKTCDMCLKQFSKQENLDQHKAQDQKLCDECTSTFCTEISLNRHKEIKHGKYRCYKCGAEFDTATERDNHALECKNKQACEKCEISFMGIGAKAKKDWHQNLCGLSHSCNFCGKEYNSLTEKRVHELTCKQEIEKPGTELSDLEMPDIPAPDLLASVPGFPNLPSLPTVTMPNVILPSPPGLPGIRIASNGVTEIIRAASGPTSGFAGGFADEEEKEKVKKAEKEVVKPDETEAEAEKKDDDKKVEDEEAKKDDEAKKKIDDVSPKREDEAKKADEDRKKVDETKKETDETKKKTDETKEKTDETKKRAPAENTAPANK